MPPAMAQWHSDRDAEICVTGAGVRSLDIAVCGRALARDDLSETDRASVHIARGKALRDEGQLSAAIADFDAALAHNVHSASAYYERALALDLGGHYETAVESFRLALELSPRFGSAYRDRAIAHFYAGRKVLARADLNAAAALSRYDANIFVFRGFLDYMDGLYREAAGNFERARELGLPYPYLPFWSYLSRARSGLPADGALVVASAGLLPGEWPGPLLAVYRGERDGADLIAALETNGPPSDHRRRLAESHFYLAALDRLHGRSNMAREHLGSVMAIAAHRMPERVLAESALGGLRPLASLNRP
jgi:lipoprotein NlpI